MKKPIWWVSIVTTLIVVAGVLAFRIAWDLMTPPPTSASAIQVWANTPEEIMSGPREVNILVIVVNDTDEVIRFDGTVLMKTGSHNPVQPSQETEVYWEECRAGQGCKFWWRGNVLPHDTEVLLIPAIMQPELPPGTHEFLEVLLEIDGEQFQFVKTLAVE